MSEDIRWQQRFQNFEQAYNRLAEALQVPEPNELERNGIVQRFEFTIELSWKVMKDYLEFKGFQFKPSPKDTFRQAQQSGYINYAQELIDALNIRNELAHDYDGEKFTKAEGQLRSVIFPRLTELHEFFRSELND